MKVTGFLSKTFFTHVMPSYTTYTEVYLQPDYPLPAVDPASSAPIGAIRDMNGMIHVFNMQGGKLVMNQKYTGGVPDRCYVGFVAPEEANDEDRTAYVNGYLVAPAPNKISLFRSYGDSEAIVETMAHTGEPLEILGRVASGYRDPITGMGRPCTNS